jgi:hypothetical protein
MKRRTFQVTVDTTIRNRVEIEAPTEEHAEDIALRELRYKEDAVVKQNVYCVEEVTAYR